MPFSIIVTLQKGNLGLREWSALPWSYVVSGRAGNRAHVSLFPGLAWEWVGGRRKESHCGELQCQAKGGSSHPGRVKGSSPDWGRLLWKWEGSVEEGALGLCEGPALRHSCWPWLSLGFLIWEAGVMLWSVGLPVCLWGSCSRLPEKVPVLVWSPPCPGSWGGGSGRLWAQWADLLPEALPFGWQLWLAPRFLCAGALPAQAPWSASGSCFHPCWVGSLGSSVPCGTSSHTDSDTSSWFMAQKPAQSGISSSLSPEPLISTWAHTPEHREDYWPLSWG